MIHCILLKLSRFRKPVLYIHFSVQVFPSLWQIRCYRQHYKSSIYVSKIILRQVPKAIFWTGTFCQEIGIGEIIWKGAIPLYCRYNWVRYIYYHSLDIIDIYLIYTVMFSCIWSMHSRVHWTELLRFLSLSELWSKMSKQMYMKLFKRHLWCIYRMSKW